MVSNGTVIVDVVDHEASGEESKMAMVAQHECGSDEEYQGCYRYVFGLCNGHVGQQVSARHFDALYGAVLVGQHRKIEELLGARVERLFVLRSPRKIALVVNESAKPCHRGEVVVNQCNLFRIPNTAISLAFQEVWPKHHLEDWRSAGENDG